MKLISSISVAIFFYKFGQTFNKFILESQNDLWYKTEEVPPIFFKKTNYYVCN